MKWRNKGHEFDIYINKLSKNAKVYIYIFGSGIVGKRMASRLGHYDCFKGFIDNDTLKQGQDIDGKLIISLDAYLVKKETDNAIIILGVSSKYRDEIEIQLKEYNLVHGKHYFYETEFFNQIWPVMLAYLYDEVHVALAQISLTERCTLKCKKCAHACYAVSNDAEDLPLAEVYHSADAFFAKVDYINEFVLIGGEPLLYRELAQSIEYIGSKYRSQMCIFSITTNGTIVPSDEVLALCKKYDVLFRISNYTVAIPKLKKHHERLIAALNEYQIPFDLYSADIEWMDYGFEYVNREESDIAMEKVFNTCKTPCREIRGNKYYYCVMARTVSDNLGLGVGQDDYLDLEALPENDAKKIIFEFENGYSDKGYLDMCRHCHGADSKNHPIPVAEQLEK